jgi:hypothetical protein
MEKTIKRGFIMTEKQKINLLNRLNDYKDHLIINMTDKKLYDDYWQKSDINRFNKDLKLIKKLINNKGHKNEN